MQANQILLWLATYLGEGREVKSVMVDSRWEPRVVTFEFLDGFVDHQIDAKDREQFMTWWKQAAGLFRAGFIKEPLS